MKILGILGHLYNMAHIGYLFYYFYFHKWNIYIYILDVYIKFGEKLFHLTWKKGKF
jgi:hypothetical protein